MNQPLKKYLYIALAAAVVIGVGVFFLLKYQEARLTITSREGASIFVSEDRNKEFSKIGTTSATFTTRTYDTVYVRVVDGDATTHTSIKLEGRGSKEITVELKDIAESKRIVDESFSYPYFEGRFVYGINPETNMFAFEDRRGNTLPDNTYVGLPYIDKVSWENANNFVYRSPIKGVGLVSNGQQKQPPYINEGFTRYFDFAKHPNRPLVLADTKGLYVAGSDLSSNQVKQIQPLSFSGDASIFADKNAIYVAITTFAEAGGEGDNPEAQETTITTYSYAGEKQREFTISESPQVISKVISISDSTLLALGEEDIFTLDKESETVSSSGFYFQNTHDLVLANNHLYVLSDAGLWQYNQDVKTFYKVAGYPEDEEYVSHSLVYSGNKQALFYSASPQLQALREGRDVTGGTYRVNLADF